MNCGRPDPSSIIQIVFTKNKNDGCFSGRDIQVFRDLSLTPVRCKNRLSKTLPPHSLERFFEFDSVISAGNEISSPDNGSMRLMRRIQGNFRGKPIIVLVVLGQSPEPCIRDEPSTHQCKDCDASDTFPGSCRRCPANR